MDISQFMKLYWGVTPRQVQILWENRITGATRMSRI